MILRALLVSLLLIPAATVHADPLKPTALKSNRLGISPRVSEIKPARSFGIVDMKSKEKIENRIVRPIPPQLPKTETRQAPLMLSPAAVSNMNTPLMSFDGISNQDNVAIFGRAFVPPDTVGDVGPNHYVQMVNKLVEIFDKSGNSLAGPFRLSDMYNGTGSNCEFFDDGDPIVVYDELADRWLLSQFITFIPSSMCIAISTSADPTGSYFVYEFPHLLNLFGDYPKVGVWPDGYYVTVNNFTTFTFNSAGVFAFDRADMLAGNSADYQYFDVPDQFSLLPADLDGSTPPPAGAPEYIATYAADEFGDAFDGIRLFEIDVDFTNVNKSTFTDLGIVAANTDVDPLLCLTGPGFVPCVVQRGSPLKLDSLNIMTMFRLQYRNFTTYETLVVNHTVDPNNSDRAGIRYYSMRRNLPAGSFFFAEQGTHQVADTNHRWMGSAAMDKDGNLAVGYSVSGPNLFPSIRYAGRLSSDPAGLLAQGEQTLIAGSAAQKGKKIFPGSRWGDYSALTVDPTDDCTFWFTTEYYSGPAFKGDWRTRIGSFSFGGDISPTSLPIALNTRSYNQPLTPSFGSGPFTFTIANGALPNGLTLSTAGVISGTPNDADGEYNFTVHVAATSPSPSSCAGSGKRKYTLRLGCIYCDDFEDGIDPVYSFAPPGTWNETGGALRATSSGKAVAVAIPAFATGCSNCTVEADMQTGGGPGNKLWLLAWRSPDGNSQIELLMREETDKWILKQRVAGSVVAKKGSPMAIVPGQNYHVVITFDGNVFEASVDGSAIITVPRAGAFPVPAGTVGFQVKATTGSFGSILVY